MAYCLYILLLQFQFKAVVGVIYFFLKTGFADYNFKPFANFRYNTQ